MTTETTPKNKKVLVGNPAHLELEGRMTEDGLMYLIMDLPFGCNYNCPKCYRMKNVSIEDLDIGLRKDVIRQASELGAQAVYIAGEGEPLFHKDVVKELIRHDNSLGLTTLLYSNGSLLDQETAQFLFDNNTSLIVSVDSFDTEVYRELTGGGDIAKVRDNLERTREIYKPGVKRRPDGTIETRLGMITIATQQNKDELQSLREWCKDDVYFICNFPIKEGSAVDNWDKLVGNNLSGLREAAHQYTETGFGGLSAPRSDGKCVAIYNGITVDTNGDVLVCPASVNTKVGNIADEKLEDLWKKVRKHVEMRGNPPCITRDIKEQVFRHHDGIALPQL